jgi:hypothetical protein
MVKAVAPFSSDCEQIVKLTLGMELTFPPFFRMNGYVGFHRKPPDRKSDVDNRHFGGEPDRRARAKPRALAEWLDNISFFRPLSTWLAHSCRPKCTRAQSPT